MHPRPSAETSRPSPRLRVFMTLAPRVLRASRSPRVTDDHHDEGQKTRQLHEKEGEAHGYDRVRRNERHVNERLYYAGGENGHAEVVHDRAAKLAYLKGEDDGTEDGKVLDTVRVRPH